MIRILKNANFSNCGLGSVPLPIPASEQAETIVGKFQNISPEKETKLRRFIDTLVHYGVYNKLLYLAIPEVANSESEAIQNVLKDNTTLLTSNVTLTSGKGIQIGNGTGRSYLSATNSYPEGGTGITNTDLVENRVRGNFSFGVYIEYPESNDYNASAMCASRNASGNTNFGAIGLQTATDVGLKVRLSNDDQVFYTQGSLDGNDNKAIQIVSELLTFDSVDATALAVTAECIALSSAGVSIKETEELTTRPSDLPSPRQLFGDLHGNTRFRGYFKVMFEGKFLNAQEVIVMRDAILNLCKTA